MPSRREAILCNRCLDERHQMSMEDFELMGHLSFRAVK